MPLLNRRGFVAWAGAVAASLGFSPYRATASTPHDEPGTDGASVAHEAPAPPFPAPLLDALGAAVLPSALGATGTTRAARRFSQWIAEYHPGAEELHPYGSAELTTLPPSPLASWQAQLSALDAAARQQHHRGFAALGVRDRQQVVRSALEGLKVTRMPAPLAAPHVALALMAHFYDSPDATDLCYEAQIRKNECRPLVNASRRPLPIVGVRR